MIVSANLGCKKISCRERAGPPGTVRIASSTAGGFAPSFPERAARSPSFHPGVGMGAPTFARLLSEFCVLRVQGVVSPLLYCSCFRCHRQLQSCPWCTAPHPASVECTSVTSGTLRGRSVTVDAGCGPAPTLCGILSSKVIVRRAQDSMECPSVPKIRWRAPCARFVASEPVSIQRGNRD